MSDDNTLDEKTIQEIERVYAKIDAYEAPFKSALQSICETIGYGRVMQLSSQMWQEKDPVGSFVVGTCKGSTVPCGCKSGCDWCGGCRWLTKHTKAVKDGKS
jgi:hypothetical protein